MSPTSLPAGSSTCWIGNRLSAAALDRFLEFSGQGQFFGTQFQRGEDGIWRPGEVDPLRTEALREEFRVPDAEAMQGRAQHARRKFGTALSLSSLNVKASVERTR